MIWTANGPPKDNEDRGEYRKNKRKGGKGNRGDDAGPSESVFAAKVSLSAFEPHDTTAAYSTLALLVLFVCALVMMALHKLKNMDAAKQLQPQGTEMSMKTMHCVVDGQAVY